MSYLRFFVYPVVGSFLGFITNYIAIKLLFRPKKKVMGIQGLLPKRKSEIAERAGHIVNALVIVTLAISLLHNTSAPEFRAFLSAFPESRAQH